MPGRLRSLLCLVVRLHGFAWPRKLVCAGKSGTFACIVVPDLGAFGLVGMLGLPFERLGLLVALPELLGFAGADFGTSLRVGWFSFWVVSVIVRRSC